MRRRLRTRRTNIASRYIKTEQIAVDTSDKLHDVSKQYVEVAEGSAVPQYVIHPDLLDPSSSVIVQGLDGAMAGHLVLVSENGELLLQCDAKDFPHLSHTDARQITVEPSGDEGNCEHGDTSYVTEEDNADLTCDLKILSSGISQTELP